MALYKTHVLVGIASSFLLYYFLKELTEVSFGVMLLSLFFIYLGSVFPDLDHSGSKIHRDLTSFIILVVMGAVAYLFLPDEINLFSLTYFAVSVLFSGLAVYLLISSIKPKHRGKVHSFEFGLLSAFIVGMISLFVLRSIIPGVFFFVSFLSHLLIDRLS